MPFKSLSERIDQLPRIICGPIVRRAEDKGVTVWLALRIPVETVVLSVFEDAGGEKGERKAFATDSTVPLGRYLHVVAVTATPPSGEEALEWGKSYLYDLAFDADKADGFKSLRDEGVLGSIEEITYPDHHLPAFVLPPKKVAGLHLVHGSCRNTVGKGLDAMQALDNILAENRSPEKRPQQLFLTGDQIYADEVDDNLLFMLTDAARVLLGDDKWEEELPDTGKKASELKPALRTDIMRHTANFTMTTGSSHLLSLGEYFAMYLFVWSDTLWPKLPAESLTKSPPEVAEVYPVSPDDLSGDDKKRILQKKAKFEEDKINLCLFQQSIPKIRRALANIATYMIFDDHEATDDWHLNRDWVEEVYQKPLGRRVMMNALAAIGVFQGWGNTPERFVRSGPDDKPAGRQLLEAISAWIDAECETGHAAEGEIAKFVNVPFTKEDVDRLITSARSGQLPASETAVQWPFTFRHPNYEAIFTDARTQRALPDKRYRPSEHLSEEAVLNQIPLTNKAPEFTLFVSPCNLVTVNYFRNWVAKYGLPVFPFAVGHYERHNMAANNPDLADSWVPQSRAFENVIAHLGMRVPVKDGKRNTRVVVISGDVHFSAVMRLQYWADRPFRIFADDPVKDAGAGVPKSSPTEMVLAHLVTSAYKNQVEMFRAMHYLGYEIDDILDRKEKLPVSESYLGYQKRDQLTADQSNAILLNTRWFPNFRPSMLLQDPLLVPLHQRDGDVRYPAPDWTYRIDAIRGEGLKEAAEQKPPDEAKGFFGKMAHHFYWSKEKIPGSEMISTNSLGEFDFSWEGEGVLPKPMIKEAKQFEVEVSKPFPQPPFQVVLDSEVIEILSVASTPPIMKVLKLRRGADGTKAAAHAAGAPVKVRKSVNQTNWIVEKGDPLPSGLHQQVCRRLTRFVVPMAFEDPKYTQPDVPLA